eukprot:Sspe_Gene.61112::Locus_33832_Transcript_1_1_Confidence_1.000_Length_846::g.61112::m.61112
MTVSSSVKLVVVGDSGSGKTTLVTGYVPLGEVKGPLHPTIGFEIFDFGCSLEDDRMTRLQIWDTAGKLAYRRLELVKAFYNRAHGVIVVADATSPSFSNSISSWVKEARQHASEQVPIAVFVTKFDQLDVKEQEPMTNVIKEMKGDLSIDCVRVITENTLERAFGDIASLARRFSLQAPPPSLSFFRRMTTRSSRASLPPTMSEKLHVSRSMTESRKSLQFHIRSPLNTSIGSSINNFFDSMVLSVKSKLNKI